uniref:GPI inositol-deacylase n=1 Tax=Myripristis murdjan TaxID=586833 RepID=A0A668A9D9_9TELE
MKLATVAFYGLALGLLAVGLRELLTGFEENRCSMTYMFEYPEYRRVALPRRVARLYPAYGLYLYGEGLYAQETRALKLTGAPVLFLPGNAGSFKQARSLGSVALRKAENMEGGLHLNVFTVDFNEELVALYGGSLRRQTHFLHESIKAILRLYKDLEDAPRSVVLVGHSMGGVVARALFTLPRFNPRLVTLIITQASPHLAPVLALDTYLLDFYSAVRHRWVNQADGLRNVTVLSVGGGYRDYQVRSGLTSLPCPPGDSSKLSLVATAVPRTWVSTDHLSIVWCKELVLATVRALFDLIEPETRQVRMTIIHVYQAFRINVASHCKVHKERLPNVYRMKVPWFREDSLTTVSTPSVTEISGMLHTSRPDNTSGVLLQLHTAPNCQYKVLLITGNEKLLQFFFLHVLITVFHGKNLFSFNYKTKYYMSEMNDVFMMYFTGQSIWFAESLDCFKQPLKTHFIYLFIFIFHACVNHFLSSVCFKKCWINNAFTYSDLNFRAIAIWTPSVQMKIFLS